MGPRNRIISNWCIVSTCLHIKASLRSFKSHLESFFTSWIKARCYPGVDRDVRRKIHHHSQKYRKSWIFWVRSSCRIADAFPICVDSPRRETICPSNNMTEAKMRFSGGERIRFQPRLEYWSRCPDSFEKMEKITMSSIYKGKESTKRGKTCGRLAWNMKGVFVSEAFGELP